MPLLVFAGHISFPDKDIELVASLDQARSQFLHYQFDAAGMRDAFGTQSRNFKPHKGYR